MSLLADLLAEEKIPAVKIQPEEKKSVSPSTETPRDAAIDSRPAGQPLTIQLCPTCQSSIFWTSTYRDGVIRCSECQPPPGRNLVNCWLLVVPRTRPVSDADPASEFQYEMRRPDFTRSDDPGPARPGARPEDDRELARVLPNWHFPRWPDYSLLDRWTRLDPGPRVSTPRLADPFTLEECTRCSSQEFRDVEIHAGRSTRRECSRCGLTRGFPRWAGSDANTLAAVPVAQAVRLPDALEDLF